jgi:PBSX family phage terminase large subunit
MDNQRKINKNFAFLIQKYNSSKKRGVILEGSSRSGKTISSVDFIIYIGTRIGNGYTINVLKETYNSFKTTLYDDFNKRLIDFGLLTPFEKSKEVITFNCLGNKVNFIGCDKESKFQGASCDFLFMNEMLDIEKNIFDQSEMRCRKFWWGDYNPKVTEHWVYNNVIPRDDVAFLHSTFDDNPFISDTERAKILSYEDTPENRRQSTVDLYKWKVYGLGIRAAMEGLIFPDIIWVNEFPKDCEAETYGLDFGYTQSPSAFCRIGIKGRDLFLQKKFYTPTKDPDDLGSLLEQTLPDGKWAWADSADPGMITDLKNQGFAIYGVHKFRGMTVYGNNLMNKFRIHIVRDTDFRKEQENYKYKEINGIRLNEPIDDWNHLWDAARYGVLSEFRYYVS